MTRTREAELTQTRELQLHPTSPPGVNQTRVTPSVTTSREAGIIKIPTVTGTIISKTVFEPADCKCGTFNVRKSNSDLGYLFCDYGWVGPTSVDNKFEFTITQQYTAEMTKMVVAQMLPAIHQKEEARKTGQALSVVRNDTSGYTYALTYPINSNTLTCGEGQGAFLLYDLFQIKVTMDSCNYSKSVEAYVDAIKALERCAQNAINNKYN